MSRYYSVSFDNVAVSAAQDLFEVATASSAGVRLHGLVVGQSSDYGDSAAEGLRILIIRAHTSSGSGGSAPTPTVLTPGGSAASSTTEANNTTPASGGSPVTIHADTFNVQAGYQIWWPPEMRPACAPSSRIVVNLPAAPADALTMSATLYFEETS